MKSMKNSRIVTEIPRQLRVNSHASSIKKCEQEEEFFATKNCSRILRNPNMIGIKLQALVLKFQTPPKIPRQSEQDSHCSDCRTNKTSDTIMKDEIICFSAKKIKKIQKKQDILTNTIEFNPETHQTPPLRTRISAQKPSRIIKIQEFLILKKIGEGTYSEVFSAIEQKTGFICSLKRINKKLIKNQFNLVEVLIRQIKVHSHLNHKNLVNMYGFFDDQQNIYLIEEYCACGNLYEMLRKRRRICEEISLEEISTLLRQLCEGIQSMHNDYLMHRDIKPENIFLTLGNQVKLGDFGWSVYYGNHEMRNTQCGTPLYLAPELVGKQQYSETVDIWAIGILAYQLLTGDNPFHIYTARDIQKVLSNQIDFEEIQDDIARDFVKKLLQKNADLRVDIDDVLSHQFLTER